MALRGYKVRNRLEMRRQIVAPYFFRAHILRDGLTTRVQLFRLDRHLPVFNPDIGVELSNETHVGYRPTQPDMIGHHAFPHDSDVFGSPAPEAVPTACAFSFSSTS